MPPQAHASPCSSPAKPVLLRTALNSQQQKTGSYPHHLKPPPAEALPQRRRPGACRWLQVAHSCNCRLQCIARAKANTRMGAIRGAPASPRCMSRVGGSSSPGASASFNNHSVPPPQVGVLRRALCVPAALVSNVLKGSIRRCKQTAQGRGRGGPAMFSWGTQQRRRYG